MSEHLHVDDALERILAFTRQLPAEALHLADGHGRVLAEDIVAGSALPPFANSSMDGFAVRAADTHEARKTHSVTLRVVMDIPAGAAPENPLQRGEAARIMTGAPLPDGADAVVPVEDTDSEWTAGAAPPLPPQVTLLRHVNPGDYVRPAGENIRAGETVLRAGSVLRPQDIGMLAALGIVELPVIRQPRVAVISTGDELVDPGEPPAPGQVRDSNSYTLAALVASYHAVPFRLPIAPDRLEAVRACFERAIDAKADAIISSAGVSVGTFDIVRTVLGELGSVDFWRVNLRPGKPLAFGNLRGIPFFGLPGNPVSAMVTFDIFVRPALLRMGGRPVTTPLVTAITGEAIESDGRRSYLRVTLSQEDGALIAHTTGTQSSGALMSMVLADGLLIVPEGVRHVPPGSEMRVRLLRPLPQPSQPG